MKALRDEQIAVARTKRERADAFFANWLDTFGATVETFFRGLVLGAGSAYLYETLVVSTDFFTIQTDLLPRMTRAWLRASTLGVATGLAFTGGALFLPFQARVRWLTEH